MPRGRYTTRVPTFTPPVAELSLLLFTLLLQAAAGTALGLALLGGRALPLAGPGWALVAGLAVLGTAFSLAHLEAAGRAWRAVSNWRHSWLSREVLAAGAFTLVAAAAAGLPAGWLRGLATVLGLALMPCMARVYRLAAVPAWNTPVTPWTFLAAALLLGAVACGALVLAAPGLEPAQAQEAWRRIAVAVVVLGAAQAGLTAVWFARLPADVGAGILAACPGLLTARLALAGLGAGAAALALAVPQGAAMPWRVGALAAAAAGEVLGRILFYAGRVARGVYRFPG